MKKRGPANYKLRRNIVIAIVVVILSLLWLFRNVSSIIVTASAIALIVLFHLIDYMFDVRFKPRHYAFITFIAIAGFIFYPLYSIYPGYDKFLHFVEPIMLASFIFHMSKPLGMRLRWRLTYTFFVAAGFMGLHEIGEYLLDSFFNLNLQGVFLRNLQNLEETLDIIQDPLNDTMMDMILGYLGAALYVFTIAIFFRKKESR